MNYRINIYIILIAIGILQIFWPNTIWLVLYWFVAAVCFVLMLLYLIAQFLMSESEFFGNNQTIKSNKTFYLLTIIRQASALLVAWLMNDPWALWLTVSLIVLGMSIRFMTLKRMAR